MLKNFLITLKRYKVAGVLNILGLTLAFVAFYIIAAQVWHSVTYNRPLKDSDRVYLISALWGASWAGDDAKWSGNSPQPISKETVEMFPDAIISTHLRGYAFPDRVWSKTEKGEFQKYNIGSYDFSPNAIDVFGFEIIVGEASEVEKPNTVIISESVAQRMNVNVGDEIYYDNIYYEGGRLKNNLQPEHPQIVVAIFKDFPKNTFLYNRHIFKNDNCKDGQSNSNWNYGHFVKFNKNADLDLFKKIWMNKYAAWYMDMVKVWMEEDPDEEYIEGDEVLPIQLLRLDKMYFNSNLESYGDNNFEKGSKSSTFTLAAIAFVIVIIAFINFINFFMALVPVRMRSVNICKVFGAGQGTLRRSFLFEAVGLVLLAFVLALGIIQALQGSFITEYVTCSLSLPDNLPVICIIFLLMILLAVISALYPAFHITKFNVSLGVKRGYGNSLSGRRMRRMLAGVQFVVAMILIIVAASFFIQYRYMVNFDIGLDKENILTFTSYDLRKNSDAVIDKLNKYNETVGVTASGNPVTSRSNIWGRTHNGKDYYLHAWSVRWNFPEFFGIGVLKGDEFNEQSHSRTEMLITHNLHTEVGVPIGYDTQINGLCVCGVIRDIRLNSIAEDNIYVGLCCFKAEPFSTFYIRLQPGADIPAFTKYVKDLVQEFAPGADEPEVMFFNQAIGNLYNSTKKATVTIGLFALLAVVIALMGVFGIVMFETQHRRNEIAIRKVYGAERGQLVGLLNNQYVSLVLFSFVVAAPVAWWIVQRWLEQFANRIAMPWWIFVVALLAVLAVTVALVTVRSWRASGENPVEVIRS